MTGGGAARSTNCSVCERLILPGESVRIFRDLERGGRRRPTCPLCHREARARGWVSDGDPRAEATGAGPDA
mgnify:CR=1 FL=1